MTTFETMFTKQERKEGLDIGNPKLLKFGKEIDIRTWINENNIDCEIYETLEKYGTLPRHTINAPEIYGELEKMDLRTYLDRQTIADNMWTALPLEIRKEFNHNVNDFIENGQAYMAKKIEDKIKAETPAPAPAPTQGEIK